MGHPDPAQREKDPADEGSEEDVGRLFGQSCGHQGAISAERPAGRPAAAIARGVLRFALPAVRVALAQDDLLKNSFGIQQLWYCYRRPEPQGLKCARESSVAPTGLDSFIPLYPALKRWAISSRPLCGLDSGDCFHLVLAK